MRTRKQKIEFLNGLMTGKRTINELRPVKNYAFIKQDSPEQYKEMNGNRILTPEQLDKIEQENPNSVFIIFVPPHSTSRPGANHIDFSLAS